jgi:hypothetical protein
VPSNVPPTAITVRFFARTSYFADGQAAVREKLRKPLFFKKNSEHAPERFSRTPEQLVAYRKCREVGWPHR